MNTHELIDAQFDRAVQIVQGLPKTGPIQTGYEEKLAMYRCVCGGPGSSDVALTCLTRIACTSRVRAPPELSRLTHRHYLSDMILTSSDRRQRQGTPPGDVGHAWARKVVSMLPSASNDMISMLSPMPSTLSSYYHVL